MFTFKFDLYFLTVPIYGLKLTKTHLSMYLYIFINDATGNRQHYYLIQANGTE